MTSYYFIFISLILLGSCNTPSPKETIESDNASKADTNKSKVPENRTFKIDIQSIKECASEGITSFNMDSLSDPKKYLDNSFINNTIGKIPVYGTKEWFLQANEYERFSCYQWEENENYFIFNLLQQDESCCFTMYICLADKQGTLLSIHQLGLTGGDGGWSENDWGEKIEFGKFKLHYDSYNEEDKFENETDLGYTREHTYTEVLMSLNNASFDIDTLTYNKTDSLISKEDESEK